LSLQQEVKARCPGCGSYRVEFLCLPECTYELGWPPMRVQYYMCKDCKKVFYRRAQKTL